MPRRAAKIDNNQTEIVAYFKACGWSVESTAGVGDGFPDIETGKGGVNINIEIKDGAKKKLRTSQNDWHKAWQGTAVIMRSLDDVQRLMDNYIPIAAELERLMEQLTEGLEKVV